MDLNVTPESSSGSAVACPVCTLYLREGISLQRHLDTHPKEQVIEALIKASSNCTGLTLSQHQSLGPPPPPPAPSQSQTATVQPLTTPNQTTGAQSNSPHLGPGTPYPIGPVFEYPMMPPQFASFSYQQFVNNGTMMIPQYSMAPPPPPQANQMMQMLYNPYSMYQQQQVPTVQMLSPVTTIPTTRIRPVVTVAETSTRNLMMPSVTGSESKLIEAENERILPDIETPGDDVAEAPNEVRNDERLHMEDREQQTRGRDDDDEVRVESSTNASQVTQLQPERRSAIETPQGKPEDEDPLGDRVSQEIVADSQEIVPIENTASRTEISPEVEHLEHFLMNMMEDNLTRNESPKRPEDERGEGSMEVGGGNCQDSKPYPSDTENEVNEVEISKVFSEVYRYKRSVSAPASPTDPKKSHNLSSRSECGSTDNLNLYPMGFEAATLHEDLDDEDDEDEELDEDEKDNFEEEDMEIEEIASPHTPFPKNLEGRSHSPLSAISGISGLRVRTDLSKPNSPASMNSFTHLPGDSEDETDNIVRNPLACPGDGLAVGAPVAERKFETSVLAENSFQQNVILPDNYSPEKISASQNPLEELDPTTSAESKRYSSKPINQPPAELLNINEDAHSGPMNVFEFDGLQIIVPSTFISESSQKAISATSQQSMASSEGGIGVDEEVKSVNMRADETMPPRGELSEQESNGCTEPSAWQLYMGQESSRMSTSYDLMARESWEESEGSDNETGVPLLDSKSLATHFTSSLFLDRDRKTPTKQRTYKCSLCSEIFDCPKERRVHITTIHKEPGPSNSSSNCDPIDNTETKDIKLLEGRMNVFEEIFVPGIHVQPTYHQLQGQAQNQGQSAGEIGKTEPDEKPDALGEGLIGDHACAMCSQRFTTERNLQAHNRRIHGTEVARRLHDLSKCQICNEQFTSVGLFNDHLKVHPLECSQCGKYFYRKQNFRLHMKRHLGIKPFPCTVCDKAFLTKQKLDEHMNGHTGNAPVKCNMCSETFRRYSNLTQHKNRHHLNIKKKLKDYICHCGEVFHTKKKLAWHKETHDEKPKACTYCNERFIHMASLTRHMRRAHNRRFVPDAQRENENVECPICKCIYLRSSLSVHMRVHNGERPFECQVCSKSFSTKWNLQLHKWTHAARSTKPYKCNQCSAAFYRHSDYVAHMNAHRNFRPYTCNYCGAQFIRKYNCLRHVKEHEENKQYSCDVCNKTFHRSYYLKEHLRVHSGVRPYTCHICGKSSSTKSNHNKHVRIHHAREPVNTEN